MPKYTVWTNATDRQTVFAPSPGDAAGKYHKNIGELPKHWNGALIVRDEESGEEITFRRKQKAA